MISTTLDSPKQMVADLCFFGKELPVWFPRRSSTDYQTAGASLGKLRLAGFVSQTNENAVCFGESEGRTVTNE